LCDPASKNFEQCILDANIFLTKSPVVEFEQSAKAGGIAIVFPLTSKFAESIQRPGFREGNGVDAKAMQMKGERNTNVNIAR